MLVNHSKNGSGALVLDDCSLLNTTGTSGKGNGTTLTAIACGSGPSNTFGSSSDLWGGSISRAQVNSSSFGVQIRYINNSASTRGALVNYIQVNVHYHVATTKSVAGSCTATGVPQRQTGKKPAGSITSSGLQTRRTGKQPSGSCTSAGATRRASSRTLAGQLTASGVLARGISLSVSGALTLAGSVARTTRKTLAGAVTLAGNIVRRAAKVLAGAMTLAGALVAFFSGGSGGSGAGPPGHSSFTFARARTSMTLSPRARTDVEGNT